MDTKAIGQDLVNLGERVSDFRGDAVQRFSRGVQGQPAAAVLLALAVGAVFGFLLGFASKGTPGGDSREPRRSPRSRPSTSRGRRRVAHQDRDREDHEGEAG
jgi:hypothetical protein